MADTLREIVEAVLPDDMCRCTDNQIDIGHNPWCALRRRGSLVKALKSICETCAKIGDGHGDTATARDIRKWANA